MVDEKEDIRSVSVSTELSFSRLFVQHFPMVFTFLRTNLNGDPETAKDLTQETFLRLHTTLAAGSHVAHMERWLIHVARHCLIDHWRVYGRHERSGQVVSLDDDEHLQYIPIVERENWSFLSEYGLTDVEQELLLLYVRDKCSHTEIAEMMGISVSACRKRLERIRKKIKNL